MIRCQIADLIVDVPATGGMTPRCENYRYFGSEESNIKIFAEEYRYDVWPGLCNNDICYLESGVQFYNSIIDFNGLLLHASAVNMDGKAYLFSGPCGMGKSTHTRMWQQVFGPAAQVFNDDKPALRRIDGVWYAFGTPWCGKDGINQNKKVPIAGICFLKQCQENRIRSLNSLEAFQKILSQTRRRFRETDKIDRVLKNIEQLVQDIPVFELENRPEPDAARLSYETMLRVALERNL